MSTIKIDNFVIQLPSDARNLFNPCYAFGGSKCGGVLALRDVHSGTISLPMDAEGNLIVTPGHAYNVIFVTERNSRQIFQDKESNKKDNPQGNTQDIATKNFNSELPHVTNLLANSSSLPNLPFTGSDSGGDPQKVRKDNFVKGNEAREDSAAARKKNRRKRNKKDALEEHVESNKHTHTKISASTETTRSRIDARNSRPRENVAVKHDSTASQYPGRINNQLLSTLDSEKVTQDTSNKEDKRISVTFSGEAKSPEKQEGKSEKKNHHKRNRSPNLPSLVGEIERVSPASSAPAKSHKHSPTKTSAEMKHVQPLAPPRLMPTTEPSSSVTQEDAKKSENGGDDMPLIERFGTLPEPKIAPSKSKSTHLVNPDQEGENTTQGNSLDREADERPTRQASLTRMNGPEFTGAKRRRRAPLDNSSSSESN